ncbi:hypothetical protein TARUN_4263 [Trichoderma arundinaceum]|uniref:Uncharacterized protein n=1 Tax=Trichoderma arundinaceum TaxID=490622 RepID=A0A395NQ62_TRIAR|nr:hypothetical protein TARUN_4263 [Trichoderma arundinaceum]
MASYPDSPMTEPSVKEDEVFDRLFELKEEDISWIKKNIGEHVEACKRYIGGDAPRWKEALREAKEASFIAFAEGMVNIESKINFYMAHCHRGMGNWEEAHRLYMESTVDIQDIYWLQWLQTISRHKMERDKEMALRRARGTDNLQAADGGEVKPENGEAQ